MSKLNSIGVTMGLSSALLLAACGNGNGETTQTNEETNLGQELNYTITGIEPGAGTTELAHNTLEAYDNLEGWELDESSTAGMLTLLGQAIDNEEPIIVTGWTPHWKFAEYDLKFLEDPQETFGGTENINTVTRTGFEEDMPNAHMILDAIYWGPEDMESVMLEAQDGSFEEAAANWIEENRDTVDGWLEGSEQVDGESIELVSTPWDTERASGALAEAVLEEQGYDVKVTDVDPAIMFEALANGEADASLTPWLPATHASYYENHEENLVDLGPNLEDAIIGFVVPEYMDIDSIEDLEPNE